MGGIKFIHHVASSTRPCVGRLVLGAPTTAAVSLATAQWYWRDASGLEKTEAPKHLTSWSMKVLSGACVLGPEGVDPGATNGAQKGIAFAAGEGTGDSHGQSLDGWYVFTETACDIQILGTIGGPS